MMIGGLSPAFALDPNYCPFSRAEMKLVKTTRVKNASHSNVAASVIHTGEDTRVFRITIGGTKVYEETVDIWMERTRTIVADLDRNGLEDVIKEVYHGTQGLGLGCELLIFTQYESGKFARILIPSERFTPDDICDLDGDGKKEIVTCVLVKYGGHNYWVYRCWNIPGAKLACVDAKHGFPRAVWFTKKPNQQLIKPDLLQKITDNYPVFSTEKTKSPNKPDEGAIRSGI